MTNYNYIAGAIQLGLFAFLLVWSMSGDASGSLAFPVGEYNGTDQGQVLGEVPLSALVVLLAIFTLVTGLVHIFAYARSTGRYQSDVDKGNNWMRWVEYSITASIMMFVIAITCGTHSVDTLVLVVASTLCCMICGYLSERTAVSDRRVSMLATIVGWILLLASFGTILRRFGSIVGQAPEGAGPPSYVWAIVVSMVLLFMSFGFIHLRHMYAQWTTPDTTSRAFHRRIEASYTVTSMISKILLVVLLASGLYARDAMSENELATP